MYFFVCTSIILSMETEMLIDFFPNEEDLQVCNWQIDTVTLIAIVKAQRQNFCGSRYSFPYRAQNICTSKQL